ncbi:MAG: ABC transporter substrate-binding protein [Chloroflexi bacterium]|nr:ABC transporter substrate-binding protein [Chloroflexota bacterium]
MTRWGFGLFLALSLLALIPRCNLAGTAGGNDQPPLPLPPTGPTLRIALISPTTGELATFGRELRNGSILAFDEWNSHGGVLGRQIEWLVYDTDCVFGAAQGATQQAVADGFQFMIGPLCSEAAIAAAAVAEANEALLLAPTATHPLVTVNGQGQTRPTVFRVSYAYPLQGQAAARFAVKTLKVRRAALFVDPGDDYSITLGDAFAKQFAVQGGEIVYRATYTPTDADFTPSLQAAGEAGAEVIYLPGAVAVVNQVAGQLKQFQPSNRLTLLGSDSWAASELDLTAAAGSYFTTHFFLEDDRPTTRQWAEAYKASYAVAPDTLAALGYDAAAILMTAIQQADTFEVKTVAETLAQNRFEAITGPMTFDRQHNPIKPVPVVQIKDGRLIFIEYVSIVDE